MSVFVLTVKDEEVGITLLNVFTSREKATQFLAAWCRGQWEQQGHEGYISLTDEQSIERYFEYHNEDLSWGIGEEVVDASPSEVDHSAEFAANGPDTEFFEE
jgi:hypothetical protein